MFATTKLSKKKNDHKINFDINPDLANHKSNDTWDIDDDLEI